MQRTQTICLIALTVIAVGFSLKFLQSVLLPFVIAVFVVIGIRPLLDLLQSRFRLNRYVSVGISFLIGVVALAITGLAIWASIKDLSDNAGIYEERLSAIGTWVAENFREDLPEADQNEDATSHGPSPDEARVSDNTPGPGKPADNPSDVQGKVWQDAFASVSKEMEGLLLKLAGSMSSLLSYGIMIALFAFFLLSAENTGPRPKILEEVENQVRKYLVMKTIISIFTGIAFGGVLWLFGVPLALLFGMLAFLLNFIPNIGPLVANVLPIPLLVLNSEISIVAAIACIILMTSVQFISGNVIETRMMGKSFDVSPVVLLLALMFFGLVWGIVGMFLATPLISIIKIVLQNTKSGQPIAELMAGRWTESTRSSV